MTGKIKDAESWNNDMADFILQEAGLRVDNENTNAYLAEEADAIEVICVMENLYDVLFNKREHARLARLMRRGYIGRPCFLDWVKQCNRKPARRVAKDPCEGLPLFQEGEKA